MLTTTKNILFFILFLAVGLFQACQNIEDPEIEKPDCTKDPSAQGCKQAVETFPAPTNLSGNALDQTSIHLTWTNPSSNQPFQIEIQMKSGSNNFAIVKKVEKTIESFDVNHLTGGTTYTFRIRALGSSESAYTSEVSVSTMDPNISALYPKPTLTSSVTAPGQVTLNKTWSNNNSSYVAGIQYQMMVEGEYNWLIIGSGSFSNSFLTIPPAGIIQYKIKVIYTDGSIYADEAGYVIAKLLPPTDVTGSNVDIFGITKHKITWEYPTSPAVHNGYTLMVSYNNTSNVPTSTQVTVANATVKTYTMIPACKSGSPVTYRVIATSSNTNILSSNQSSPILILNCP